MIDLPRHARRFAGMHEDDARATRQLADRLLPVVVGRVHPRRAALRQPLGRIANGDERTGFAERASEPLLVRLLDARQRRERIG